MKSSQVNRRKFMGTSLGILVTSGVVGQSSGSTESGKIEDLLAGFTWIEQSGFRIESEGKVLYFDPIKVTGTPKDADLICISHSHDDHCSLADVKKLVKARTIIYTEPSSAAKVKAAAATMAILKPGDGANQEGFLIQTVPAYNLTATHHPKSSNLLGFIITLPDGRRVYQAGDTDFIPEMKTVETDIALLPVGGMYTMDASQAAEAAKTFKPKLAVPMHYGYAVGSVRDAESFAAKLKGEVDVFIFTKGQSIPPKQSGFSNWRSL